MIFGVTVCELVCTGLCFNVLFIKQYNIEQMNGDTDCISTRAVASCCSIVKL